MSRYSAGQESDEAFQPGSGGRVLRNKLGITDPAEMDLTETRALFAAFQHSIEVFESDTKFSVAIVKDMHMWWLGQIYPFAGELRTVNVSKGGVLFAPVEHLTSSLANLDEVLSRNTPADFDDRDRLVQAICEVHVELILVHPFREGNGRLGRWLADLMANQAGCPPLVWGFGIGDEAQRREERERYFEAMRNSFAGRLKPLQQLVFDALAFA